MSLFVISRNARQIEVIIVVSKLRSIHNIFMKQLNTKTS